MQKIFTLLKVVVLLALCAGNAFAEPKSGFGLNAGMASNNMSGTTLPGGTAYSYASTGLSVGADYQFVVSDSFSINPLLMSSGEDFSGTTLQTGTTGGHGIFGVQLRYWVDDIFIGAHVAKYLELLSTVATVNANTTTTTDTNALGGGRGLVSGWEPSSSEWFVMGQVDTASIDYLNANVKLTGFRLSVGYRWE
jgi:hypothetical protein